MRIGKVACWLLRIPFTFPLVKEEQHALANFIEIETDDGLKGHALSTYPLKYGIREFINREVAPVARGMDALRPEEVRTRVFWATARKYFMGAWNNAASLIDIALWDIRGKALGQPVWKLLGGAHPRLPAYVTFGLPRYSTDELVEVARMLVADGHTRLKMVVAAGTDRTDEILGEPSDADIVRDAERVRALREAVGPSIEIMIDANKGATLPQAVKLAKLCEPYDLAWFEDPVRQGDGDPVPAQHDEPQAGEGAGRPCLERVDEQLHERGDGVPHRDVPPLDELDPVRRVVPPARVGQHDGAPRGERPEDVPHREVEAERRERQHPVVRADAEAPVDVDDRVEGLPGHGAALRA